MAGKQTIIDQFVVFEGLDGSGTTTQLSLFEKKAKSESIAHWVTCEPTTNIVGRTIRSILGGQDKVAPGVLAELFAADRRDHLYNSINGIISHIEKNELVISDRYLFSSLAYQSFETSFEHVLSLNKAYPLPKILFYFTVPLSEIKARLADRSSEEIFEQIAFQEKVEKVYKKVLDFYKDSAMTIHVLDGTIPADQLADKVFKLIMPIINK